MDTVCMDLSNRSRGCGLTIKKSYSILTRVPWLVRETTPGGGIAPGDNCAKALRVSFSILAFTTGKMISRYASLFSIGYI